MLEITGQTLEQILSKLGDLDYKDYSPPKTKRGSSVVLPNELGPLLPAHIQYLKQRGFNPEKLIRLWGIQGIGLSKQLSWRIFIPIILNGETISWTTRSISDNGLRYITASPLEESENHRELIYGEDHVRHSVVVVEGPIDVWRIGPGAVATMGTGYSRAQLLRISKYPLRCICFDSENTAQRRARQLANDLSSFSGVTTIAELSAADPGSADKKEIQELRRRFLR